jgi:hypothetical protein
MLQSDWSLGNLLDNLKTASYHAPKLHGFSRTFFARKCLYDFTRIFQIFFHLELVKIYSRNMELDNIFELATI